MKKNIEVAKIRKRIHAFVNEKEQSGSSHHLACVEIGALDRVVVAAQVGRRGDECNVEIGVVVPLEIGRDNWRRGRGG